MSTYNERVRRLQQRLDIGLTGIQPVSQQTIFDHVAEITLECLADPAHLLTVQLNKLKSLIKTCALTNPPVGWTDQNLFLPQPASSSFLKRQYWALQLFLHMTARSIRLTDLAAALQMPEEQIKAALAPSLKLHFVGGSTHQELYQHLKNALASLDAPQSAHPMRLEGNVLIHPLKGRVTLTNQERDLMALLLSRLGGACTHADLKAVGIQHPSTAKKRLAKKLADHHIDDYAIHAGIKSYSLVKC